MERDNGRITSPSRASQSTSCLHHRGATSSGYGPRDSPWPGACGGRRPHIGTPAKTTSAWRPQRGDPASAGGGSIGGPRGLGRARGCTRRVASASPAPVAQREADATLQGMRWGEARPAGEPTRGASKGEAARAACGLGAADWGRAEQARPAPRDGHDHHGCAQSGHHRSVRPPWPR